MIWLELRTKNTQFYQGWNFSESSWAPVRKENGSKWPFWESVGNVIRGDTVIHLKNVDGVKTFVGYSIAESDGYVTTAKASDKPHDWDYRNEYFKVELGSYTKFDEPILLSDFFHRYNADLRRFYALNKSREKLNRRHLFYTIQKDKLQCLFGAYFSEFDDTLFDLLQTFTEDHDNNVSRVAETSEEYRYKKQRKGQDKFAEAVKRNYRYKCAYPKCCVEGNGFLVGGHIDRWSDNMSISGETSNGICLCLMHDKAFEKGYFTINEKFQVVANLSKYASSPWLDEFLAPGIGLTIKRRSIDPSLEAIQAHWKRIGYKP